MVPKDSFGNLNPYFNTFSKRVDETVPPAKITGLRISQIQKEPSLKTAEFKEAKKLSPEETTVPKNFSTNLG